MPFRAIILMLCRYAASATSLRYMALLRCFHAMLRMFTPLRRLFLMFSLAVAAATAAFFSLVFAAAAERYHAAAASCLITSLR